MARIDDLVNRVGDAALRTELEIAVMEMRRLQRFGLVFEAHIPETTALMGLSVHVGSTVQKRKGPSDGPIYRVTDLVDDQVTIAPIDEGETTTVPVEDVLAVKRMGEPIYPALTSLGTEHRGQQPRPAHAVINAENYQALQLLVYLYEGRIDCIYIDPPYNTGARDWRYNNRYIDKNDVYRHSKWLSAMERRLLLSKRLLTSDGILVVTIDENEHAHLVMLLERIFPRHALTSVAIVHNPRGVQGDNFSFTNEFAIFVIPEKMKLIAPRKLTLEEQEGSNLRNWGGESLRTDARNCFYPIYVENDEIVGYGDVPDAEYHPATAVVPLENNRVEVWPIDNGGIERKWRYARQSVEAIHSLLRVVRKAGRLQIHIVKETGIYKTVWQDPKYDASVYGSKLVKSMLGEEFPFPKSLYAVHDVLYACTATRPNAIILDFFAGSGTTLHATCLLNSQDGGQRQCILVTNNDVAEAEARRLNQAGLFRGDPGFESHGIFEQITQPRIKAAITGNRPDGTPLEGECLDKRPMADGYNENVEFFRLDYLDPDDVGLGMQFNAILPALWLAAGGIGDREPYDGIMPYSLPPNSTYGVLFKASRFGQFKTELAARPDITHVYIVTNSDEGYAEMRSQLPTHLSVHQLYESYLRNFAINTERLS